MYKALDIAKYVLSYYKNKNIYITNSKLQILLFFIQLECVKNNNINNLCFEDDINAFAFGVYIPSVSAIYASYLSRPIFVGELNVISIDDKYKNIINLVLDTYEKYDDLMSVLKQNKVWQISVNNLSKDKTYEKITIENMKKFND